MTLSLVNNGDTGLTARTSINAGLTRLNNAAGNWTEMTDVGIDCTGATDATSTLQAVISAMPDYTMLKAPAGAVIKLSSTITLLSQRGISIVSDQRCEDNNGPTFQWSGAGTGPMFYFESCDTPTVRGFLFNDPTGNLNTFLKFDKTGLSGVTGTLGLVEFCSFNVPASSTNASYRGISISETEVSNQENYRIQYCNFNGSNSKITQQRSVIGVTNGTTTLTAADGAFVAGDVGKRLLVSWATGSVTTTVASVTNGTTIVMGATVTAQTNATIHIGQGYGTGIYVGQSANSKDHIFRRNRIGFHAIGIEIHGGSFTVDYIAGGYNDCMIQIDGITEPSRIISYQSEFDVRCFLQTGAVNGARDSLLFIDTRGTNAHQRADGWIYFFGLGNATVMGFDQQNTPSIQSNAVLFGWDGSNQTPITSIGCYYNMTWASVNLIGAIGGCSINDVFSTTNGPTGVVYGGVVMFGTSLPTSSTGLITGQLWNNSGVLNVK